MKIPRVPTAIGGAGSLVKSQNPIKTVRVGIYQNKPKVFLDEAGNPEGFWVDLLEHIADAEDWSLEYVPCEWNRCLQAVEQGQLDLMMDVAYSEERDRLVDFNQEVVLASWPVVYARSGLKLDSVLDLEQKRVAVLKDSIEYATLAERTRTLGIQPQFIEVANFQEMFRLLDRADVDTGVINRFFGQEIESQHQVDETHILISPAQVKHFIFPEGKHLDLRMALDRQLEKLIADSNSAYYQALEYWLEPEERLVWAQIKHILLDLTVYVPIVGLIVVLVWNRFLNQEVNLRKQAECQLISSENKFRSIFNHAAVGIIYGSLKGGHGRLLAYNPRFCQMLGYTAAELAQLTVAAITHPDDRAIPNLSRLIAGEIPHFSREKRYLRKDGTVMFAHTTVSLLRNDAGNPLNTVVVVEDISDRKKAEAALQESESRYRKVVEAQSDFILQSLPDTTITFANKTLCCALGNSLEDILGKKWIDFANPDDLRETVLKGLAQLNPTNPRFVFENRDNRADCQVEWTQWLNEGIFNESGQLVEIQSVGRDITKLKQVEQALRESEERLRLVTENMSDLVCLHHPDGRYVYVTSSSQALLGYCSDELIGRDSYELFHPDDRERIRQEAHKPALNNTPRRITYRIRHKKGDYIWLETLTKAILDAEGQVVHLQTTSRDISDRIQAEKQLKYDALHDSLTGLPNRSLLMERLELALKRAKRHPEFQFAVLFLDLDNFKIINDSLGHLIGDQLLLEVATQLKNLIRETDLAARLGGDEFVMLLEEIEEIEEVVQVAERILTALRSPLGLNDREVFTSTSIGIVVGSTIYQSAEDLLRDADLAMYRAKQSGRGQYTIFDPAMHLQVLQRLHLENDLRKALENDEFTLYYQPIFELKTEVIQGFEALIRWQHPQRGFVSPGEFIAIAEETELIAPMGHWILHTASQQLASWQAQFPAKPLRISINLSVKQLQSSLLQQLEEVLATYNLQNNSLGLEITESMLVQNVEVTRRLLEQIKAEGICLSIDDFGTGYSSLSYLNQLPVDTLKIDRTFVSPAATDTRNQVIAESVIALSNALGLKAIAEGIETPQQLQWLKGLDCELGQGFLFSPPVTAAQATELLKQSFR